MSTVLQLTRRLESEPEPRPPQGIVLRTYAGSDDIPIWLALRQRAFARLRLGVRDWVAEDFQQEFLSKPWWRPEHLWFAETQPAPPGEATAVGTIALAFRGEGAAARPVVHWLAVLPAWRRRGVGRFLVATLEARAWELGYRQVWLETHAAWTAASELYRALGYEPA